MKQILIIKQKPTLNLKKVIRTYNNTNFAKINMMEKNNNLFLNLNSKYIMRLIVISYKMI